MGGSFPRIESHLVRVLSVGKWEGDEWVVNTIGIKESTWMDNAGRPHSDALHS